MNSDDERAAREWLETWACRQYGDGATHATTILRLLDRPVLPRWDQIEVPILIECGIGTEQYRRLHAHLTAPPKPKKVEVWAAVNASGDILAISDGPDAAALICEGARIIRLVEAADE